MVVFVLLFSCWLFLSNLDQLVPDDNIQELAGMGVWVGPEAERPSFAGSFWEKSSFWRSLNITLVSSTITMIIAAFLGIPAAYALSRYEIPGKTFIDVLLSSIIVLPSSSVGLCLIILFQFTWLFDLQKLLNMHLVYSLPGIIVVQLVLSLAMGIRAWKAAFDEFNPRFELVARSLGSSSWRSFVTVTLPCVRGGIVAGCIVAWARAAAEFGGILIFCSTFSERPESYFSPVTKALALNNADPFAVSMWSQIEYGNMEYGFALGFTLVLVSAVSVYVIHRLGGKSYQW
jgi:molybdate transport system permease protein